MDAVVCLQSLQGGSHKGGEAVVAVVAEVQCAVAPGVRGQTVLGEVDGRRVEEG